MMNCKTIISTLIIAFTCLNSFAQVSESFINQTLFQVDKLATDVKYANSLNNGRYIEGTPYYNKDFETGIFYINGLEPVKSETKLNLFENRFEYMRGEQVYYVDPESVDSVLYKNKTYVYRDVEYDGLVKQRLVEKVTQTDDYQLCKVTAVVFKPEVEAGGYIDPEPAKFEWEEPVYWLSVNGQNITLTNFSKVYRSSPDHKKKIRKFVRKNRVKKDDEEGLVKLLEYLSEI